MSKNHSIVLVDDHPVLRNGLKGLIEKMGPYKVEHQFDNGKSLIDTIPFINPPDLIIMDLNMPVMDGRETTRWLKENNIVYPVLIFTIDMSDKTIIELFRMGIRGYLPKSCSGEVLKKAINDIILTGYYHNELLSKALMMNSTDNKEDERLEILAQLTEKERSFFKYVCDEQEYTYEQIATMMGVSRRTVDGYRESLFLKFNIKSKTGLVLFAIKYQLIKMVK